MAYDKRYDRFPEADPWAEDFDTPLGVVRIEEVFGVLSKNFRVTLDGDFWGNYTFDGAMNVVDTLRRDGARD